MNDKNNMSLFTECTCGYSFYACNGIGEGHCIHNPENFKLPTKMTIETRQMKVIETFIVIEEGRNPKRLYKTAQAWFYEQYNFVGSFIGLRQVTDEFAQQLLDGK